MLASCDFDVLVGVVQAYMEDARFPWSNVSLSCKCECEKLTPATFNSHVPSEWHIELGNKRHHAGTRLAIESAKIYNSISLTKY